MSYRTETRTDTEIFFHFNIMNIVTQMRKQRFGMIQTKEQYQFCYEIVLEVLQNLLALN